ncbi:hypothetical protein BT69DRAFT_1298268 [Atractiella rhizophila]|nr:hypothetical protein BT69DRAFT_1298268 [Atractiella rhizophila]
MNLIARFRLEFDPDKTHRDDKVQEAPVTSHFSCKPGRMERERYRLKKNAARTGVQRCAFHIELYSSGKVRMKSQPKTAKQAALQFSEAYMGSKEIEPRPSAAPQTNLQKKGELITWPRKAPEDTRRHRADATSGKSGSGLFLEVDILATPTGVIERVRLIFSLIPTSPRCCIRAANCVIGYLFI